MIDLFNIEVSESSPTEPVTLDEAKAWVGVDFADHDDLLTSMITGSRQDVEQLLNGKLVAASIVAYANTTRSENLYQFPWALKYSHVDIDSVIVYGLVDGETDETLTINDDYYLNGSLKLTAGSFKLIYDIVPVVPQALKEAIMMLVAYRYNNRGDQEKQQGIPVDIEAKISKYRQIWL